MSRSLTLLAGAVVLAAALPASPAAADFVTPVWDRPADDSQATGTLTTLQGYDTFAGTTDQTPDVVDINPNGSALLSELTGGAFVAGSGNIYSPGVATQFLVSLPAFDADAPGTNFQVQIRTQGSELDIASLQLDGAPASDLPGYAYEELDRVVLGGFGGSLVDHRFTFFTPTTADSFDLTFGAAGSSMSLDAVTIDTFASVNVVPEPASLAGLGLTGLLLIRRR